MQSRNSTNIDLICLEKARSHTRDRGRRRVKVATAEEIVVMVSSGPRADVDRYVRPPLHHVAGPRLYRVHRAPAQPHVDGLVHGLHRLRGQPEDDS